MSENLNDTVTVLVEDASVITVPIDDTLQNSGEAADAKAVGDALALKADLNQVTGITVNGQSADNQGAILVDGSEIEMNSGDNTKLDAAIGALQAKAADTILYEAGGADTIKQTVDALDADVVHTSEQTLTDEAKVQARTNIGALGASDISHIGTMLNGTNETGSDLTWSDSDWHSISTLTIPLGTWLIIGQAAWTSSFSDMCAVSLYNATAGIRFNSGRSIGLGGGGVFTITFLKTTDKTVMNLYAMQGSGSNKTVAGMYFRAVRIA